MNGLEFHLLYLSNNNSDANTNNSIQNNSDLMLKSIKKSPVIDDNLIDNQFKQVEDGLMNLSRVLSSLYLTSLTNSTTSSNTTVYNQPPPAPQQQMSSSSSVKFILFIEFF